jgi:hypothetical protein
MPHIIIIERDGNLKQHNVKDSKLVEETLYKKIGLKTNNNFERVYSKNDSDGISYYLYGKKVGKSNLINKSEQPFLQNMILYGNCIMLKLDTSTDSLIDFQLEDFSKFVNDTANTANIVISSVPPPPPPSTPSTKQRKIRSKNAKTMATTATSTATSTSTTTTNKKKSQKTSKEIDETPPLTGSGSGLPLEPINYTDDMSNNHEKELEEEEYII